MEDSTDGSQRALESELVEWLRDQNSKLMKELADLRKQLQKGSAVPAGSGTPSSPLSAVGGTSVESSKGHGASHTERPGRGGSRTPRSRIREQAPHTS